GALLNSPTVLCSLIMPQHPRSPRIVNHFLHRYLGSALSMLFVPYIAEEFEPSAQFKVSGVLALGWLAVWWRVGADQP
ncbi:unnamed protein product, partial [Hapterophycus canaliculatus]